MGKAPMHDARAIPRATTHKEGSFAKNALQMRTFDKKPEAACLANAGSGYGRKSFTTCLQDSYM
jgi:hypothetical protein